MFWICGVLFAHEFGLLTRQYMKNFLAVTVSGEEVNRYMLLALCLGCSARGVTVSPGISCVTADITAGCDDSLELI